MVKQQHKKPQKKSGGLVSRFSSYFFDDIPSEDKVSWKKADLDTVVKAVYDWADVRKEGEHRVRVFTPEQKRDGWTLAQTVVLIINDDRPFIVDTVSAELAAQGCSVDAFFHPVLKVLRGKDGRIQEVAAEKEALEGGKLESYIYAQLEQALSSQAARQLESELLERMKDVEAATGDWRKMLQKAQDVIAESDGWSKAHKSDIAREGSDFLSYLVSNNFTFLGYCEYAFEKNASSLVKSSALGVLKRPHSIPFGQGKESAEIEAMKQAKWPVMVSKLVDHPATVHRRVPMDAVSFKIIDKAGAVVGMHLFVGLFTSSTYSCRTSEVPVVRSKVAETIQRAGFTKGSHDAKALEHILEKMPRDELFQISGDELYALSMGILRLQSKQRIALFTHLDSMKRHMSCLIYVPRDKYDTYFRQQAGKLLEKTIGGKVVNFFTTLDDSSLARLLMTVRLDGEAKYDHAELETRLIDMGREWDERLKQVLVAAHGKAKGSELAHIYGRAFTSAYHDSIDIGNTVHDVRHIESLIHGDEQIRIDFYRLQGAAPTDLRLKVYNRHSPVPLSDILPVLENMGLRSYSEMPYEVKPQGFDGSVWIHDFTLKSGTAVIFESIKENFEEAFMRIWRGDVENDGLNQLVIRANLNWHEVRVLRAYSGYMRQARFPYSRTYVEQVLSAYPDIAAGLVDLFKALHDPRGHGKKAAATVSDKIIEMLQRVEKLDHDRIMRSFKTLIENTLRTNYFQREKDGSQKTYLAMKFDSKNIHELPLPRPHVEIFVYSSRVEAVHLRGGEIARGGIRWSDRLDDFRTEILGLLKSQQVKNTVIVPVGAKGGFVVKQPPKAPPGEAGKNFNAREAFQQEGIECYKLFVQSLLDITDNNVKGKIVHPKDVVCHDGADPYLVVAADKGTATFSDIANGLSVNHGFWMGDAFASGGSSGYDHKKLAITARGGWESVKRHFREMGKDIQNEEFTAVGVGDMAGDVFGNAVLLSKKIRLLGAFNHVHIFCDPDPDAEKSFAERQRMFKARGGWDTYSKDVLSAGGAVFERSAKVLKLTPQIRKVFNIDQDQVTPDELMRAILKANVELMWLGGIGTFVKSSKQSNADADDKSNDAVRIDGRDIRAKVLGEGANLGTTQLARVEYARLGGRINTDFIDNSAGVDCSDHEVNIKILLNSVMQNRKMSLPQRNKLLEQMTDEVCDLVLRDNYQQTQSLSLQSLRGKEDLPLQGNLIRELEKIGLVRRNLEGLPDDEGLARLEKEGLGLTRPELSVVMSYSKIAIYNLILASDMPDAKAMEKLLFDYFPKALHKYEAEIKGHRLRREIIATQIVNTLVNRMGSAFLPSRMAKTGKSADEVAKAFMIVMEAYGVEDLWRKIEALDNKVPSHVQLTAFNEIFLVIKRAVTWFLRQSEGPLDVAKSVEAFRPGIEQMRKIIRAAVPKDVLDSVEEDEARIAGLGMPAPIAAEISAIKLMASANDIVNLSRKTGGDVRDVAAVYFLTGEKLGLDWLRRQIKSLVPSNSWQARVMGGVADDYYAQQAALTAAIFSSVKKGTKADRKAVEAWFAKRAESVAKIDQIVAELKLLPKVDLEMLVLAGQRIGQLAHAG